MSDRVAQKLETIDLSVGGFFGLIAVLAGTVFLTGTENLHWPYIRSVIEMVTAAI